MVKDFIVILIFFVGYVLGRIDYLKIENKKGLFLRTITNKFIPIIYKIYK